MWLQREKNKQEKCKNWDTNGINGKKGNNQH